ncbi:uncharacterized protein [Nicotiana tomentosiformis]|uniref:uncharacterized protein n=1 Tax=Nicotiana tomentosiformis TaxID=4098 RepID=UPI00388C4588
MGHRHPGFSWSSPRGTTTAWKHNNSRPQGQGAPAYQNQQRQQFQPQQPIQPSLEDIMKAFTLKTDEWLDFHGAAIKELGTGFRNMEGQVGHIAIILSVRVLGTLPADTKRNPKETVNDVTLRSGQVLKDTSPNQKEVVFEKENGEQLNPFSKEESLRKDESKECKHIPALPFPQKLYREKSDKKFEKFLDMLKQVIVNFPFTDLLSQIIAYAKFLKEILTKKRKIEETSVVKLKEHCGAILKNKLPQKCGDLGSFTIPYSLGSINFDKSLCDSGTLINLMPLSIYRKLEKEIGEIRSVPICLELAYQTTLIPEGIVEDVLVRVDKFVFPVDFIVVNMEENKEVPLILERPFLAMCRSILDINESKLMLKVGEETVTFEMNVETGVKKEKTAASVEWKVKGSKEKAALSEKCKCGVHPKKAEKKLSAWMCALVRRCGMDPNFDSDPN